ncbi:RecT family recombinase [Streptomyces sp. NBC_01207]|uniref:RecT family recombinase n=1 Tax=Streptomyces sp. NBC_01207 TaxID=2903772 RepID=UPI002E1281B2|nr:recombinase RecT [Streptomyces sp. NBC_01207]
MSTALHNRLRGAMGKAVPAPVEAAPAESDNEAGEDLNNVARAHHLLRWSKDFAERLPACVELSKFEAALKDLVPTLRPCSVSSIVQSLLACATAGLVPDGRQAIIVADGDRAVFIPMYQGFIDLMHRAGALSVRRGFIFEGDDWTWEPSVASPHDFMHKVTALTRAERGDPIAAYAFAWLPGPGGRPVRSQVIVTSLEDAEEVRDFHSRQYRRAEESGRHNSAWHTNFRGMWAKTPVRALAKVVPLSAEVVRDLVEVDEAGEAGRVQVMPFREPLPVAAEETSEATAVPVPGAKDAGERRVESARRRVTRSKGKRQRGGVKGGAGS